jgi:hypothetical protein
MQNKPHLKQEREMHRMPNKKLHIMPSQVYGIRGRRATHLPKPSAAKSLERSISTQEAWHNFKIFVILSIWLAVALTQQAGWGQ